MMTKKQELVKCLANLTFDKVIMQIRGLQDIKSQAIIKFYHLSLIIGSAPSGVIGSGPLAWQLHQTGGTKIHNTGSAANGLLCALPFGYFHCGQH